MLCLESDKMAALWQNDFYFLSVTLSSIYLLRNVLATYGYLWPSQAKQSSVIVIWNFLG